MPTPSYVNTTKDIKIALPVKIDNCLSTVTKGLTVKRSSIQAIPVMDRFNGEVILDVCATALIGYDTTGLASALPDSRYNTLFQLSLSGLCEAGKYVFPDFVGVSDGLISGDRTDHLINKITTSSSNATGDFYLQIRYMIPNINFGYGVLFPQFK